MSAGQGKQFSDPLRTLERGDVIVAYLKRYGFVGIGVVKEKAVKVDDFRFKGKSIRELKLVEPFIIDNHDNEKSEYLVKVDWQRAVDSQRSGQILRRDWTIRHTAEQANKRGAGCGGHAGRIERYS